MGHVADQQVLRILSRLKLDSGGEPTDEKRGGKDALEI